MQEYRLLSSLCLLAALLLLVFRLCLQLLAEEVVQEGADHRHDGEADQLLLARCDRGGQNVCGQLNSSARMSQLPKQRRMRGKPGW